MGMCTEESAHPTEALTVAMRLLIALLAAYGADAARSQAAMARSRLLEIRDDEPCDADEDEGAGPV